MSLEYSGVEERVVEDDLEQLPVLLDTVPGLVSTFQVLSTYTTVDSVIYGSGSVLRRAIRSPRENPDSIRVDSSPERTSQKVRRTCT